MKNLDYIIFEKIVITFQDHNGFEEKEEFKDTWYNAEYLKMSPIKRKYIKEVNLINPKYLGNP